MNNSKQHRRWIIEVHRGVARVALALAVVLVAAVVATRSAQAQTYAESVLYSFTGGTDGSNPSAVLLLDAQGNLYGTTFSGGDASCQPPDGCGTVFKLVPPAQGGGAWTKTVLYSFTGTGGDGANPYAGLVLDAQGNLYGTATNGGASSACSLGCGTVFKLDTTGKEKVLYSFTGTGGDGAHPYAGLVQDAQGNLYGTTEGGGDASCDPQYGCGTVFKLVPPAQGGGAWTETVLYSFTGTGGDGAYPDAGLVQDAQGNLYGTTNGGGDASCGCGTVFKLNTTGKEKVLYSFTGTGGDGAYPDAGLVQDARGNLYGTTEYGGHASCDPPDGCGVVFKLDTTGKETVLHTFTGTKGDGVNPNQLVQDAQGNLYGTTYYGGGAYGGGTVFKLVPPAQGGGAWTETVLYSFTGTGGDGEWPEAGLVQDAQGNLYGTTNVGGDASCDPPNGCGTVFKMTPATKTTTTLTSSPNPSTYGQAVVFIATVTSSDGAPPNGETVSFMEGKKVLGTGTLSGGSASFTTSTLKVGTNAIKAVYAGDSNFTGSTSKALKQVVSKATATTTLTSSLNPSNFGQSVTFTASVTPQFSGTPTGKVAFYDGQTLLKSVALTGGTAKYTTKTLAKGTHTITATYGGSTSFDGSSDSLTQTVN